MRPECHPALWRGRFDASCPTKFAKRVDFHPERFQKGSPAKFRQVYDEAASDNVAAQAFDEPDAGLGRASCCEQVIDQEHLVARLNCIVMDFHDRLAVFQLVILAERGTRQLALLSHRHEPKPTADAQSRLR